MRAHVNHQNIETSPAERIQGRPQVQEMIVELRGPIPAPTMTIALALPAREIHHPESSLPASREGRRTSRYGRLKAAGVAPNSVFRLGFIQRLAAYAPIPRSATTATAQKRNRLDDVCRDWNLWLYSSVQPRRKLPRQRVRVLLREPHESGEKRAFLEEVDRR